MAIQQELKPQTAEEPLEDLYEEEPGRRPWAAIACVVLALGLIFVGYQWNQAASREQALASQVRALRVDAESQRLRAEEAQRQFGDAQKRLAALSAEKSGLEERVATLERVAKERVAAKAGERERPPAGVIAKAPPRERVVPVAAKKRR
jgi:uncharacterized protein HemX